MLHFFIHLQVHLISRQVRTIENSNWKGDGFGHCELIWLHRPRGYRSQIQDRINFTSQSNAEWRRVTDRSTLHFKPNHFTEPRRGGEHWIGQMEMNFDRFYIVTGKANRQVVMLCGKRKSRWFTHEPNPCQAKGSGHVSFPLYTWKEKTFRKKAVHCSPHILVTLSHSWFQFYRQFYIFISRELCVCVHI